MAKMWTKNELGLQCWASLTQLTLFCAGIIQYNLRGCCDVLLEQKMEKALRTYAAVLRLIRRLPKDTRPYYAKYARENFVNYREVDANDANTLDELFHRAYNHSVWVLNKVLDSYIHSSLYILCTYKCLCICVY